jgi:hypothetical protein
MAFLANTGKPLRMISTHQFPPDISGAIQQATPFPMLGRHTSLKWLFTV